jgi:hypothetical protein
MNALKHADKMDLLIEAKTRKADAHVRIAYLEPASPFFPNQNLARPSSPQFRKPNMKGQNMKWSEWTININEDLPLSDDAAFTLVKRMQKVFGCGKPETNVTFHRATFNGLQLLVAYNPMDKEISILPRSAEKEIFTGDTPVEIVSNGKVIGKTGPLNDGQHRH